MPLGYGCNLTQGRASLQTLRMISPDRSGSLSLFLGTTALLFSNLIGHGVGTKPDPRGGPMLAAIGLLLFVIADGHSKHWHEKFLRMVQFVLALGSFSVVAAFVARDLQEFHRTTYQDWGAIPPPQLIFSATYALASLAALLGINVQTRRAAAKAKLAV